MSSATVTVAKAVILELGDYCPIYQLMSFNFGVALSKKLDNIIQDILFCRDPKWYALAYECSRKFFSSINILQGDRTGVLYYELPLPVS